MLVGDAGADTVEGSDGNDQGFGGAGTEWMAGDIGNDTLDGGTEGDKVDGKLGNDRLFGNAGDDFLIGDEPGTPLAAGGFDRLEGGAGNDLIYGGKQQDFLWGDGQTGFGGVPTPAAERGIDVFQFDKGDSLVGAADTIFDFEVTRTRSSWTPVSQVRRRPSPRLQGQLSMRRKRLTLRTTCSMERSSTQPSASGPTRSCSSTTTVMGSPMTRSFWRVSRI